VLWLSSRASDRAWLNAEAPKTVKLVEAQDAHRPIPMVSYVARQRDIAELVGDQLAGADAIALRDSLKYWEGRLDVVPLEDRNLPAIVKEKVVRPKDAAAAKSLDDAFDGMRHGLGNAWGTLLGESWTEKDFRNLYPFSPALVEALVALSHHLASPVIPCCPGVRSDTRSCRGTAPATSSPGPDLDHLRHVFQDLGEPRNLMPSKPSLAARKAWRSAPARGAPTPSTTCSCAWAISRARRWPRAARAIRRDGWRSCARRAAPLR
jgi:hypothetical protein